MRKFLIISMFASISLLAAGFVPSPARAVPSYFFSTGDPDGRLASASRPESAGKFEIESGDDFVLPPRRN